MINAKYTRGAGSIFSCFFSQTCEEERLRWSSHRLRGNVGRTRRDILRSARGTYITVPAVWVRGRAATRVCSILRISDRCTLFRLFEFSRAPLRPATARVSFSSCRRHREASRHHEVISRSYGASEGSYRVPTVRLSISSRAFASRVGRLCVGI